MGNEVLGCHRPGEESIRACGIRRFCGYDRADRSCGRGMAAKRCSSMLPRWIASNAPLCHLSALISAYWWSYMTRQPIRRRVEDGNLTRSRSIATCQRYRLQVSTKLTQIGPSGSIRICPRPSILGDTEYDLTVLSWSIMIGPVANAE